MTSIPNDIKRLGFGLMRPPMNGKNIDIDQMREMVDRFIKAGFNYFDSAPVYLDGGSEELMKTLLIDRYPRESFYLATKLSAWHGAKNAEEARAMFDASLKRTGAEYFDFYLLHNCAGPRIKLFAEWGLFDFMRELREQGLVRHIGFSFHDTAEVLDRLLTDYPYMEFVQLQINYADWENPSVQSRLCYETARKHGKPVIIMEPVKGGLLANPPQTAADILNAADPAASCSSWAIRFAASLDGLITVLSGMSDLSQVEDNLATMTDFKPLSNAEHAVIKNAADAIASIETIPCTGCRYCVEGCPQSIPIPMVFSAMNTYLTYGNLRRAMGSYRMATGKGGHAKDCIACGQCEAACPQKIGIIDDLARASEVFDKTTARIDKLYKQTLPDRRLIGKRYTEQDRTDGTFAVYWQKAFSEGLFEPLEAIGGVGEDGGAYLGAMRDTQAGCEYWIGMFMPKDTPVPDGYDFMDIKESGYAVFWLYGNEASGQLYGIDNHNMCLHETEKAGYTIDKNGWYFERYACPRFTQPDKDGNVILDYAIPIE